MAVKRTVAEADLQPGQPSQSKKCAAVGRTKSGVEDYLVSVSPFEDQYAPTEKIRAVIVENFPALGKATAFRFLEWVQQNPEGVCSLPTGKTPEHFIKWVQRILKEWTEPRMQEEIRRFGLDASKKPDLSGLTFVQIDEFYPISPKQANSFYSYVQKFYVEGFGMDPKKALLIDCSKIGVEALGEKRYGPTGEPEDAISVDKMEEVWPDGAVDMTLRMRDPTTRLERIQQRMLAAVDQWCEEYEQKIRDLGGIGFIMGGIGPDGHIAFNCKGCQHYSTTRLDELNYMSQAAAAGDLGGIEAVRKRKVITIGMGTITYNPECVCIVGAAGEAKAGVVRDAVQENPHVQFPGTALHKLPNAAFYLTRGAAKLLSERQLVNYKAQQAFSNADIERSLVNLSMKTKKRLVDLSDADVATCPLTSTLLQKSGKSIQDCAALVRDSLIAKIERGVKAYTNTTFLHTEPHHDDIMLGYLPMVLRHTRHVSNDHHFVCATSGFNSVSNDHMMMMLDRVEKFLKTPTYQRILADNYFKTDDTEQGLDNRRRDVWKFLDGIAAADNELRDEGAARRFIANLATIFGDIPTADGTAIEGRLKTLRSYFKNQYPGQKDTADVQVLKGTCREFEAVAAALERHVDEDNSPNVTVWGYRNVWFRFEPCEVETIVPVSLQTISTLNHMFLSAFESQRNAEFPAYEIQGPFCAMSQKVQVEQYDIIETCLGYQWFHKHPSPLIRATRGLVFLREMTVPQLLEDVRSLRRQTENA
eukprot:TRINITY_DN12528_c0_g1_i1.p1 TRINITY_DN12528_c0_g1~~TRINITY_DN12528_c0_g1_i1.p1  ORF type:complete len:758 (+),score=174.86 TRINITY_DN12528_c0_g1_i1:74-2347(+)